ncbi:MAG: cardiolipin synthase, partial [Lachnospiraceae bacterium]|nr:cardiolipin synthase [Lachnospiraceae bacterium]
MKIKKLLFSRMVIVGFAILVQVVWVVNVILKLTEYSIWVDFALTALSILALLVVINKRENPAYKLAWTVPILVFPLLGGILYLLLGNKRPSAKMRAKIDKMMKKARPYIIQDESIMEEIAKRDPKVKNQVQYLIDYADAPIYKNTKATYFKSGEENFPYMLEALRSAKHFIFMEYFIIDEGRMWGEILEILKQKAAEGLDVRLMYDDVGCATMLPYNYHNIIEGYGIKCEAFNHMVPIYSAVMNNRDHRKILVID